MKSGKRRNQTLVAIALALLCTLLVALPVLAQPPLPYSVFGQVLINGVAAPVGVPVNALIGGVQYATTTTIAGGLYALDIPGDQAGTPEIEGGVAGQTVNFSVNGVVVPQTGTWQSGVQSEINLTLTTAVDTATPTATATTVVVDTATPTATATATTVVGNTATPTATATTGVVNTATLTATPTATTQANTATATATATTQANTATPTATATATSFVGLRIEVNKMLLAPAAAQLDTCEVLTYSITIRNSGSTTVTQLFAVDEYPAQCLCYVSSTPPGASSVITMTMGGRVVWADLTNDFGDLAPGDEIELLVRFQFLGCGGLCNVFTNRIVLTATDNQGSIVTPRDEETVVIGAPAATATPTGTLTPVATATHTRTATATLTRTATATTTPVGTATATPSVMPKVRVIKTLVEPLGATALVGQLLTFNVSIENIGVDPITFLWAIDEYPADCLMFASSTPLGDNNVYTATQEGKVIWSDLTETFGDIQPGGVISVTVQFTATGMCDPIFNWFVVTGQGQGGGISTARGGVMFRVLPPLGTPTPTATSTATVVDIATPTATVEQATPTVTPTEAEDQETPTVTATPTALAEETATVTPTALAEETPTVTATPLVEETATVTPTALAEETATVTPTPLAGETPTVTPTPTGTIVAYPYVIELPLVLMPYVFPLNLR